MSRVMQKAVLARLAGFDHLPDEDVSLLARMLREETAAEGAVIVVGEMISQALAAMW